MFSDGTCVRLAGDDLDIKSVIAYSDPPALASCFREDEGTWWMKAAQFDPLEDAAEIRSVADDVLRVLNGCAQVVYRNHKPVWADQAVYVIDSASDTREVRILLGRVVERIRFGRGRAPGAWLRAAMSNPDVAGALRIVGKEEPTWSDLYHLLELIEQISGQPVDTSGWISRKERKRFAQTAHMLDSLPEPQA